MGIKNLMQKAKKIYEVSKQEELLSERRMREYVIPFLGLQFGKVRENYRKNKDMEYLSNLESEQVYDLMRIDDEGCREEILEDKFTFGQIYDLSEFLKPFDDKIIPVVLERNFRY